ncbi:Ycf66 family protein [Synechocystis sp. PCC 7509]|uniref:Ycf66 family protein n=1 Tax=Synechocystis sp. PCC 7509 TaxID=927677 RepID=UPI0002ACF55A|nr:Ycf66 family protein [Synechocystis sp. PCC 7509]
MVNFGLNWASTLAQVNFGGGTHTLLGILLAVAGAALYFLRSVRPELSRDHDIFFAAIGLVCGVILISQGWRLDPILQFGQVLLVGSTVFFAVESIRLRGIATEQAKRNTKIVDDDRPVSNYYQQAEIDELEVDYDRPARPRIPGSRDPRASRPDLSYEEDETPRRRIRNDSYEDEQPRRTSSRDSDNPGQVNKPNQRRSSSKRVETRYQDEWDSPKNPAWDEPKNPEEEWGTSSSSPKKRSRPTNNPTGRSETENLDKPSPRPRKRRPTQEPVQPPSRDDEAIPTDYVDYKPIDRSRDDDPDNSTDFDQF